MPQPSFVTTVKKFEIDNVGGVSITDPVSDGNGNYVRELRVVGILDANNPAPPLVFTLRLSSSTAANISLATPILNF